MKHILHMTALALAMTASAVVAENPVTALADLQVTDDRTDRPLEGFVWYPTADTQAVQTHHGNPVWQGIEAVKDADALPGKYPLVVLSHGMYGNAMNQSWLADALVAKGFIVAAVHHPGTSTWMRDADQARQMWDRPRDVSRVIDHMLSDPAFANLIDDDKIYMAGHSLGGFTAVALAGGRYDAEGFEAFCDSHPAELVCGIFDRWQVAKTPEDKAAMQADLSDDRIKGFAVFDLGGTQTFARESLAGIDEPMLIFGAPRDIQGLDLDIESRALVAALPMDQVTYLEPTTLSHFDFLGVCTDKAEAILAKEEPDDVFVCQHGQAERAAEHAMIAAIVAASFR
ncbi:MAG: alpha/beta fold hydrolase [Sulfitobacter sp.]|nr:alpha/beta fold hydrolase [Sulfitobacter sp.]